MNDLVRAGIAVAAVLAVVLAASARSKGGASRPAGGRGGRGGLPGWTDLEPFRAMFPEHVAAAEDASERFRAEYQRTFVRGTDCVAALRAMFRARSMALSRLRDARMRLPNSLALERALVEATEDVDRRMMEHAQDVRDRCGLGPIHPGPVGDAWYARWYRASNDVLE